MPLLIWNGFSRVEHVERVEVFDRIVKWFLGRNDRVGGYREMMSYNSILRERAGRDENIQYFFRGFELPFRAGVAYSPYLTVQQKQQMDAEVRFRAAVAEFIARSINALI